MPTWGSSSHSLSITVFTLANKVICNDKGLKEFEETVCKDFVGIGPCLTYILPSMKKSTLSPSAIPLPPPAASVPHHQTTSAICLCPSVQHAIASFICIATRYPIACLICTTLDQRNGTQKLHWCWLSDLHSPVDEEVDFAILCNPLPPICSISPFPLTQGWSWPQELDWQLHQLHCQWSVVPLPSLLPPDHVTQGTTTVQQSCTSTVRQSCYTSCVFSRTRAWCHHAVRLSHTVP